MKNKNMYSSPPILRLLIISKNNYIKLGMQHFINKIQPELLQRTDMLCDIKTMNHPEDLDIARLDPEATHCLVIEREFYPALKSLLSDNAAENCFNNVFFLSSGSAKCGASLNFLPCKPSLGDIRKLLYKVMMADYGADPGSLSEQAKLLSSKEKALINMTLEGKNVRHIAKKLSMTPQAVYASRARILEKIGVRTLRDLFNTGTVLGLHE